MATPAEVREALRKLHAVSPADAGALEAFLEDQEQQILRYTSEDVFKAFVLEQAQQSGVIQGLLQRLDSSILGEIARAEAAKRETALIEAREAENRAMTTRQVLTQPVVLAAIGVVSALLTTLSTILLHLAGVT